MTLGNNNGTDGQTDRQTDRQSATQYAAPPREEGRIITLLVKKYFLMSLYLLQLPSANTDRLLLYSFIHFDGGNFDSTATIRCIYVRS